MPERVERARKVHGDSKPNVLAVLLLTVALGWLVAARSTAQLEGETGVFERLQVSVELLTPVAGVAPDDNRTRLEALARFEAVGGVAPDDSVVFEIVPPVGGVTPDDNRPVWQVFLPSGCFEDVGGGRFRADGLACGGTVALVFADGSQDDLGPFLTELEAVMGLPPDDSQEWRLRLQVEAEDLPAALLPPDPIRGSTRLQVGDSGGEVANRIVGWVSGIDPSPF